MSSSLRLLRVCPAALAVVVASSGAYAEGRSAGDLAQARELLNEGIKLREKGDAKGALEKFRGAHALVHTPITGLELGRTYASLAMLVEARETFISIARIPVAPEETQRSSAARSESAKLAEELRPRIPSITVRVTGVQPDSVSVTIDGTPVPLEALASPRLLDPGTHDVIAKAAGGGTAETKIDLKESESRDVEMKLVAASAQAAGATGPAAGGDGAARPVADKPEGDQAPSGSHVFEWSLIGGGAAVGAAGAILMVVEMGKASDANDSHDKSSYDSASAGWTAGLVGALVGAGAVATGGILLATSKGADHASGARNSYWVTVGASDLRIGGTW